MRGGEKVVEALCRILPDADIFTLFYEPEKVSPLIRSRVVHASFLNPARRFYRMLLPAMPFALESFDLSGYDLVVSSESGPAKGVMVGAGARHVCYCHTPMRYLWDLYPAYLKEFGGGWLQKAAMAVTAPPLRLWDFASATRVDDFVANSENVQKRIRRAWGRESSVVYPPVPVNDYFWRPALDYYLMVSELVAYKRLDYAIRACSERGIRLRVVGGGPEYKRLKTAAGPSVEFCGRVSDEELLQLYAGAKALIVPGEEDFGMTMVESLASGKPVIALSRGGACEIVAPDCGILFDQPTGASLAEALRQFDDEMEESINPVRLQMRASRFSSEVFDQAMRSILDGTSRRVPARIASHESVLGKGSGVQAN